MANVLTGSPLVIDTAGATSQITTPVVINAITVTSNAAKDQIKILDSESNRVVFDVKVGVAGDTLVFTPAVPIVCPKGIIVSTLTASATANIYI